jgi:hypothetical protein
MRVRKPMMLALAESDVNIRVGLTFPGPPAGFNVRREDIPHGTLTEVPYDSKGSSPDVARRWCQPAEVALSRGIAGRHVTGQS